MFPLTRRVGRLPGYRQITVWRYSPEIWQVTVGDIPIVRHIGLQTLLPESFGHEGAPPFELGTFR